jgi:hypothetical protein
MNRAERRRQLKEDEITVARGLDVVNRNGAEVVALMRVLLERVRESQRAQTVRPLMDFLLANIDQAGLRVANVKVACGKGCAHCCNSWVSVIAPEVIHVVNSLGPRRAVAQAAVNDVLMRSRGKSHQERGKMVAACPLLVERVCTVYPNRPLTCRTGTSLDVGACERGYTLRIGEEVPVPTVHARMRLGYSLAVSGALRHAGLNHAPYEFHSALERVMTTAECEARWLAGADILAGLPQDPAGDPFQMRENRALYDAAFAELVN